MKNSDPVLIHVVLISFLSGTSRTALQEIYDIYQTIAEECGGQKAGILYWKVEWNLDTRKNVHLVEVAVFSSQEALHAFRVHPAHTALTDKLKCIANWQVGGFLDSSALFVEKGVMA